MPAKRKAWAGRIYLGRDAEGRQKFWWVGRYPTRRERDDAVAKAKTERPWERKPPSELTGDDVADRYLEDYAERAKASSLSTAAFALKAFRATFGARAFASIERMEAREWARTVPASYLPHAVTLGNYAVDELELIGRNPFRGVAVYKSRGRADRALPNLGGVLDATAALGDYGPQMRALLITGALTGMRPGELYELRWGDVDLERNRVTVSRRVYRGVVDTPKNGRSKRIALPPPARDALMEQAAERFAQDPQGRTDALVFVSKQGKQLTPQLVGGMWAVVRAAAGLPNDADLYLTTKHWGVNFLWKQGVSERAIGAQMGWSERGVQDLLRVYGHKDVAALEEIDALYASELARA